MKSLFLDRCATLLMSCSTNAWRNVGTYCTLFRIISKALFVAHFTLLFINP